MLNITLKVVVVAVIVRYPELRKPRFLLSRSRFLISPMYSNAHQRCFVFENIAECSQHALIPSQYSRSMLALVRLQINVQSDLGDCVQDGRRYDTFPLCTNTQMESLLFHHRRNLVVWSDVCHCNYPWDLLLGSYHVQIWSTYWFIASSSYCSNITIRCCSRSCNASNRDGLRHYKNIQRNLLSSHTNRCSDKFDCRSY